MLEGHKLLCRQHHRQQPHQRRWSEGKKKTSNVHWLVHGLRSTVFIITLNVYKQIVSSWSIAFFYIDKGRHDFTHMDDTSYSKIFHWYNIAPASRWKAAGQCLKETRDNTQVAGRPFHVRPERKPALCKNSCERPLDYYTALEHEMLEEMSNKTILRILHN